MATSTTRSVELQIKLSGVETLEQLEQVTSEINAELKQIDINSEAFTDMANLAKKANSSIKEIDSSLEGVTNVQKTESLFKLGEGLAGAFAIGQSASLIFGEKTSEQLEKTIAKVGGLVIALDGVKKISEAFSASNIAGLKGIVSGFKASSIGATLFGTTARAALTATGIGIIVVILGLIVSNWEKVKVATVKAFEALKNYVPLFYVIGKSIDYIKEKFGSIKTLIAGIGGAIKAAFKFENIADGFNQAVEASKKQIVASAELVRLEKELLSLTGSRNTELENQNEILSIQGGKESEILANKLLYNKELVKQYDLLVKNSEFSTKSVEEQEKILEGQAKAIQNIKVINAQEIKLAQDKKKAADEAAKSAREKKEADEKEAADKLKENEENKKRRDEELRDALLAEKVLRDSIEDLKVQRESLLREGIFLKIEAEIDSKPLFEQLDQIQVMINNRENSITKFRTGKGELTLAEDLLRFADQEFKTNVKNLVIDRQRNELNKKRVASEITFLEDENDKIQEKIESLFTTVTLEELDLKIQEEIETINNKRLENQNKIVELQSTMNALNNDNKKIAKEGNKLFSDRAKEGQNIFDNLKRTLSVENQLNLIWEDREQIIGVTSDLVNQLFELEITQLEAKAELEQRNLDELQEKKEGYANEDKRLNDLLADAEGERYDDILKLINANSDAMSKNSELEIESKKKINAYELKAAKARKTQATIDTIIQGVLGVVEAAPNLFLMALVGALTAASVATILAQPNPQPIALATGGIVPGTSYSGDKVNAKLNSGEMVLNTDQQTNLFKQINTPTPNVSGGGSMIDYRLIGIEVSNALKSNPMFVSVTEFNTVQNRLKIVENRSSLVG